MTKRNILIVALVVLLIALAAGGYIFWQWKKSEAARQALEKVGQAAEKISESAAKAVLSSVGANPLESKPDVNPADKANPFKNIITNPFQ